jgi:hypothetical protein
VLGARPETEAEAATGEVPEPAADSGVLAPYAMLVP